MLYPTVEFLLFFTFVLILNWLLKKWPLIWKIFLLLISYYFYSIWDVNFLFVLIVVSFANYLFGYFIYKNFFRDKKFYLWVSILFNISILGFFKYYDFFRVSFEELMGRFGFHLPLIEIILPIGLSFYIFKVLSFNFDIYREKIYPYPPLLDFFIFMSFFLYLLSGPIVRGNDFLPQLKKGGARKIENFHYYLSLIFFGLFKKLIIASWLSLSIVEDTFAAPENHSFFILLLAVIAYSLTIYFDFSSYSDLTIGFAGLMGFRTPINFDFPYLARNLKEFWRKWHITLSYWARDYIYIPLGGNRKGELREYFNLMIAMTVIGIWHGASVHFIFWGVLQGIGLVFTHFLLNKNQSFFQGKISLLITFSFISSSWIFFKAENMERAVAFLKSLFFPKALVEPFKIYILFLILIGIIFFIFERKILNFSISFFEERSFLLLFFLTIFLIAILFKLAPDTLPSFIYFGF
jgi:D-alanyl-lipoteichoic acid acyltransferase DltB (MBOAT superfamily)